MNLLLVREAQASIALDRMQTVTQVDYSLLFLERKMRTNGTTNAARIYHILHGRPKYIAQR